MYVCTRAKLRKNKVEKDEIGESQEQNEIEKRTRRKRRESERREFCGGGSRNYHLPDWLTGYGTVLLHTYSARCSRVYLSAVAAEWR